MKGTLFCFEQFPVRRDIVCVSSFFFVFWGGMAEVSKLEIFPPPVNKRSNTKITLTPPLTLCIFFTKSSCKIWPLSPRSFLLRYGISHRKVFIHQLASPQGKRRRRAKRRFPYVSHRFSDAQKNCPNCSAARFFYGEIRWIVGEDEGGNFWTICGRRCMCIFFLFEFRLCLGARSTKRALVRISQLPHCPPPPVLHSRKAR